MAKYHLIQVSLLGKYNSMINFDLAREHCIVLYRLSIFRVVQN